MELIYKRWIQKISKNPQFIIGVMFLVAFHVSCNQPSGESSSLAETVQPASYDSLKAMKYGADELGMKKYVMAFLRRGPNQEMDSVTAVALQMAHMKNIGELAKQGKLILAGPFFGNDDLRGIYIFNVSSLDEALELTNTDPAVQAGRLAMDLKEWYGSAALMEVNDIHATLAKRSLVE